MIVAITGASGFIGSALAERLSQGGHTVRRLARPGAWDPAAGRIDRAALEGADAVVHLAGESIFGRWTAAKKRRIIESRVPATTLLADTLARLTDRPRVFVSASAIGIYGDRGNETLTEQSAPGTDFLAAGARDWETAAHPAAQAGIRVVHPRFGVVLGLGGGALGTMLPPFRLGLGGPLGSGRQWFSWITLDDALAALRYALTTENLAGPVNVVAPNPVTNRDFARALGRALGRPAVIPVPTFALELAFGAEAAAFMMSSQRVVPARLLAAGFTFRDPEIEPALRRLLAAPRGGS